MIGLNIGLGMGLGYNKPLTGGKVVVSPPEPDITDALLMEDGVLFMMEDGSYFRLEEGGVVTRKIDKSYWKI